MAAPAAALLNAAAELAPEDVVRNWGSREKEKKRASERRLREKEPFEKGFTSTRSFNWRSSGASSILPRHLGYKED